ncbi:MAG: DUF1289 domain-containing protein [Gammaproteobacteria bacterium]|nr:DUF1289 domain-containing protein [Gammaproteobacteria bacterium]
MTRRGRRRELDTSIPSPCMGHCRIFEHQPICQGCYRHQDEIRNWPILSAQQKQAALEAIPERINVLRQQGYL